MTFRELYNMVRQYGLDPDSEIVVQPLLKDKPRKVTNVTTEPGKMVLRCNVTKERKDNRKR